MEFQQNNSGQGLGIAGLILGIISIIFAIIPCTALIGLFLGIIGLILSIIGVSLSKNSSAKGLVISALVVSIIGVLIAGLWGIAFVKMAKESNIIENYNEFKKDIKYERKYKIGETNNDSIKLEAENSEAEKEKINID